MNEKIQTIDEYIDAFSGETQRRLQSIRNLIKKLVPDAKEKISYQMPTFELNGKNLIHFAAFKHHIGIYPTPSGVEAFQQELALYKKNKGSIQLPMDKALPLDLIEKIVIFRVEEEKGKRGVKG